MTGDPSGDDGVDLAIGWFDGDNDFGVPMSDPVTGGGFDGLTPTGPNLNQGAESTLALITTMQHASPLDDLTRCDPVSRASSSASGIVATLAPTSA